MTLYLICKVLKSSTKTHSKTDSFDRKLYLISFWTQQIDNTICIRNLSTILSSDLNLIKKPTLHPYRWKHHGKRVLLFNCLHDLIMESCKTLGKKAPSVKVLGSISLAFYFSLRYMCRVVIETCWYAIKGSKKSSFFFRSQNDIQKCEVICLFVPNS